MAHVLITPEETIYRLLLDKEATLLNDDAKRLYPKGNEIHFDVSGTKPSYTLNGEITTEIHLLAERVMRAYSLAIKTLEGKNLTYGQKSKIIRAWYILAEFEVEK